VTGEMAELAGDAAATRTSGSAGGAGLPRVLPPVPVRDLRAHEGRYGVPRLRGKELIGEVERSGLTGRGGAAYPAGKKLRWLRDLFGLVEGRGACHLPDGVARLTASALRVFADDVGGHERGPCLAARGRPVFTVPSGPARATGPTGAAMARAWGVRG
jgi:hypothetical protein